jgi:P27 family predicted phage terminase small subunit
VLFRSGGRRGGGTARTFFRRFKHRGYGKIGKVMGKRGPQPQPTALKEFRGNPGKRPLPENEPQPPEGKIVPPFDLDDIGQQVWDIMLKQSPPSMLRPYDSLSLWQFCDAWSDFFAADAIVKEEGRIAVSEKGGQYQHPAVGMKNKAAQRIKQLGSLFGWSPSDRVSLGVSEEKESPSDMLARMLTGRANGN